MTTIIDTSLLIPLFKDKGGRISRLLTAAVGGDVVVLADPVRFELLQGSRDIAEFDRVKRQLDLIARVTMEPSDWDAAALLSMKSRKANRTLRSSMDACIAQIAIRCGARLLHNDRDYEAIASISTLNQVRVDTSPPP